MEKAITTCFSERGNELLVLEQYQFYYSHTLKSGEEVWRCTMRSCKKLLYTITKDRRYSREANIHEHLIDSKVANRKMISNSAKRKAVDNLSEPPLKIINVTAKENPDLYQTITKNYINLIRNNLFRSFF